ncbi:hypothetical protein [Bradyrhizobium stylosanthis]
MISTDLIVIVSHNRRRRENTARKGRAGAWIVSSVNGSFSISAADLFRIAIMSPLIRAGTLGCVIDAGLTDIKLDRRTSQIFLWFNRVMNRRVRRHRPEVSSATTSRSRSRHDRQASPAPRNPAQCAGIFFCKKIDVSRRLRQRDDPRSDTRGRARRHLILLNLHHRAPGLVAARSSHRDLIDTNSTRSTGETKMKHRKLIVAAAIMSFVALPAMAQTTTTDEKNGHHYNGGPKTEVPHHMGKKESDGGSTSGSGGSHHYNGGPKTEVPHHMGPKKQQ